MIRNAITILVLLASACAPAGSPSEILDGEGPLEGKGDSSVQATFQDFRFTGQLVTDSTWGVGRLIEDQIFKPSQIEPFGIRKMISHSSWCSNHDMGFLR